jgi:translocation and assembly module TamB
LSAIVHAHTSEAKLLPLFVADIDRAAGELDIDAQVAGSLSAPRINGVIALKDAELDAYRLNLALREVNAQIQLVEDQARVDGSAKAGEGTLKANGTLSWHGGEPSGALHLQGEQLLVADLPEYRVVASPNLDFKIAARKIAASGVVTIPSARIQPKDLSGAVQASPDARLINDQRTDGRSQFQVSSDIRFEMGDDVRLDTFGLQGKLGGSVRTLLQPGETPIGRGELAVSDGRYTAYGQKLDIKRGRLLFERTSLDDPGLDVQAERKIEQIIVGVNVRGTLRAPTLQLYSEPSLSQPEIFSYLVVGKPLDNLQGQEAATVNSVRNSVALQGGGFLASQLGHRIGLEEVGVETTTDTTTNTKNTALVLGKFLSPRLFVSYGISLTEAINTLKLRYTISDHWVFKTEAGQRQGADFEYTIER